MNCPSRTDEPPRSDGHNQSPNPLSNDLTTNQDLKGLANTRQLRRSPSPSIGSAGLAGATTLPIDVLEPLESVDDGGRWAKAAAAGGQAVSRVVAEGEGGGEEGRRSVVVAARWTRWRRKALASLKTFYRFVGPGFVVAVAYIDPGNYSTDIAAGASYRFRLLFVVLLSNLFAIYLQSLAIKLGTVSGRNLAEACRAFLPRWLNYALYALAEIAIVATDIAEVIGTAIALNMLQPRIPLVAGCALSIADVLVVLLLARADSGTRRGLRAFELLVIPLVVGVVVCFCIQLAFVRDTTDVRAVFQGYLPSYALVQQQGLYQACGILGATVMPHSLYLGSGIVQPRLREYDEKHGLLPAGREVVDAHNNNNNNSNAVVNRLSVSSEDDKYQTYTYVPSLRAIRYSLHYAVAELGISLFTFALFVNSAILVVAGAALYQNPDALDADIFGIHTLLSQSLSPAAGTIFALALLLSGLSAGVVCTVAGQMVSEGALRWSVSPWLRRLLTRSISILPSIVIAGAVGRDGLDAALNGTQVVLSVVLPFVTAPLLWFTSRDRYMTVQPGSARYMRRVRYGQAGGDGAPAAARADGDGGDGAGNAANVANANNSAIALDAVEDAAAVVAVGAVDIEAPVKMGNSWPVIILGGLIWLVITAMNVANLVLLGVGAD
ncbi:natural resistance-associated macrophage protein [Niveomyces insectorum RCEF 264]|uniref:Natural resistance-associated macrophage protein n=1 Tax=Niveomyces insectorum RCEF 264 TaxID=1081102 RepID=A0A167ZCM5_9HYPO|nr:natural resistance-associated macrophage protein [Niveomyces insectorum RCEF 264]